MMNSGEQPLLPVRRLHNFIYCPRLFYYQWVENLFVENADTVAGSSKHRAVDAPTRVHDHLDLAERASLRSLHISSESLGITGIIDLVEDTGQGREIIDYKKGNSDRSPDGRPIAKENDQLQLAAYALLLREQDVQVSKGHIYYAAERRRVAVDITDALLEECQALIEEAKELAASQVCPPPLINDPRCPACSAYSICMPGESAWWAGQEETPKELRPPVPPGAEGETLVVQDSRSKIGKSGDQVVVTDKDGNKMKFPASQLKTVLLYGSIQISSQALQSLMKRSVSIGMFAPSGRYLGGFSGLGTSGIDARKGQYKKFEDPTFALNITAEIIRCKIHNQRVLLMRNGEAGKQSLNLLAELRERTRICKTQDELRGIEGAAAAEYFKHFNSMIKESGIEEFSFSTRTRRPPMDPVNALLSLGYSALCKELTGILKTIGLDPFYGFFHRPRYGRPALALDMMEEFRPLITDSVVISLINRRELRPNDFEMSSRGVMLKNSGHKQFWPAWGRRMDTEVTHPVFKYRMPYRRMFEVQARQLWRLCRGEIKTYSGFTTR